MSAGNSQISYSTDALKGAGCHAERVEVLPSWVDRCGTYWWFYQRLCKASEAAANERLSEKERQGFRERVEEERKMMGYHLAECEQCRRWLRSLK